MRVLRLKCSRPYVLPQGPLHFSIVSGSPLCRRQAIPELAAVTLLGARRRPLENWCSLVLEKCSGVFHSLPTSQRILYLVRSGNSGPRISKAYLGGRLVRSRLRK